MTKITRADTHFSWSKQTWRTTLLFMLLSLLPPAACVAQDDDAKEASAKKDSVEKDQDSLATEFAALDKNSDGHLSSEEWLKPQADPTKDQIRNFVLADLNEDQAIDPDEYLLLKNIHHFSGRTNVPDTFFELSQSTLQKLLSARKKQDVDHDVPIQVNEWNRIIPKKWLADLFDEFDESEDHSLSTEEIRRGLSIVYGVTDLDGTVLRSENGTRFDWSHRFATGDYNADGVVTEDEIKRISRRSAADLRKKMIAADTNNNGIYAVNELAVHLFNWRDAIVIFKKLDSSLDGFLDQSEIVQLPTWQRKLVFWLLTAFDENDDKKLSLREFLVSPLGNPALKWSDPVSDIDGDGRLSLDEFHPGRDWRFLGLSNLYFERLDKDQDQFLSMDEYRFEIDSEKVSSEIVFDYLDENGDQSLTSDELFPTGFSKGSKGPIYRRHTRFFERVDMDSNGQISRQEFKETPGLQKAVNVERSLSEMLIPKFQKLDEDHDGYLTLGNISISGDEKRRKEFEYTFHFCDFDHDNRLSLQEYAYLWGAGNPELRGRIFDPIDDHIQKQTDQILSDGSAPKSLDETATQVVALNHGLKASDVSAWDRNGDQKLSKIELQIGLEAYFGVWHSSGLLLRPSSGRLFGLKWYQGADENDDSILSFEELAEATSLDPRKEQLAFDECDRNRDGEITLPEMTGSKLFWSDSQNLFRNRDKNRDMLISTEEFLAATKSWQRSFAEKTMVAFDLDKDGSLSFQEFRATPVVNPTAHWHLGTDTDFDGRLSRSEFVDSFPQAPVGQIHWMFSHFDGDNNGELNLLEYPIQLDIEKVPAAVVFEALDSNQDRTLTVLEAAGHRPDNNLQLKVYDAKVMRIEDAIRTVDEDADGQLSLAEFTENSETLLPAIYGKKARKSRRSGPTQIADLAKPSGLDWKTMSIITFNLIIVLIIIAVVRKPKVDSSISDDDVS